MKYKKYKAIMIAITCTILTAIAQALLKYSTAYMSKVPLYANLPLIAGLITYAIASVLLVVALRDADLSIIYPFIALSFVWVALLSVALFKEHISLVNIIGIISILIGVSLIGRGGGR